MWKAREEDKEMLARETKREGCQRAKGSNSGVIRDGKEAGAGERASGAVAEGAWRPACALVT